MSRAKYILFYLIILLMILPAVQKEFQLFHIKPLNGDFVLAEKPVYSKSTWLTGEYQLQYDNYLEQHIGFRNSLVRLNNQIDFSLYRKANAEGVVIGKDDHLYEYDYIRAYTGHDYVGEKYINEKLNRLKFVQDHLKKELNIDLILIFEPGKASFYPEYIPDRYLSKKKTTTNYSSYLRRAEELDIRYIDLNRYFLSLKDNASYPLYPKYGIHWSIYGMSFVADTLVNYIEHIRNTDLVNYRHDSIVTSSQALKTDYDVGKALNLLCKLPSETLAYPVFEFEDDSIKKRPMVLAVADSYYWNIFNTRLPLHLFGNEAFWYFNAKVYPDSYYEPTSVEDLDLKREVEKQDVILLMVTERFLYKFDWGFIDRLYYLYTPDYFQYPQYDGVAMALSLSTWFDDLIEEAHSKGVSLPEILWSNAGYLFEQDDKPGYLIRFGQEYIENIIRNDKEWSEHISEKAKTNDISYEEMLQTDADYVFRKDYPKLYDVFHRIRYFEDMIRKDSLLLKKTTGLASFYRCQIENMIRYQAMIMYDEEQVTRIENIIRHDPEWLRHVKEKAEKQHVPLDEMIRLDAEYMYDLEKNKSGSGS